MPSTSTPGAKCQVVCTPTQHFSGRALWDFDRTLWASFAVLGGGGHRLWFGGDTGYNNSVFRKIGQVLGPFDLAAVPIGAYLPADFMRPVHVNPPEVSDCPCGRRGPCIHLQGSAFLAWRSGPSGDLCCRCWLLAAASAATPRRPRHESPQTDCDRCLLPLDSHGRPSPSTRTYVRRGLSASTLAPLRSRTRCVSLCRLCCTRWLFTPFACTEIAPMVGGWDPWHTWAHVEPMPLPEEVHPRTPGGAEVLVCARALRDLLAPFRRRSRWTSLPGGSERYSPRSRWPRRASLCWTTARRSRSRAKVPVESVMRAIFHACSSIEATSVRRGGGESVSTV